MKNQQIRQIVSGGQSGVDRAALDVALKLQRPQLVVDLQQLSQAVALTQIRHWCKENAVKILNVAGPRASAGPQVYADATQLIAALLT